MDENVRSTKASALAPLTGVLFVVLTVVSLAIGGEPPDADASAREVVRYWVDHDSEAMIGSVLEGLAAVALVFFAATLYRAIRRREQTRGLFAVAAFGGGVVAAAGIGVDAAIRFAAADVAEDISPDVLQTLNALWANFFFPMVIGVGTLVLAASLASLRTRMIPKWLAWIGLLIFVAFFTPAGFAAFLASALWIIVVSILLWRHESKAAESVAAAPL